MSSKIFTQDQWADLVEMSERLLKIANDIESRSRPAYLCLLDAYHNIVEVTQSDFGERTAAGTGDRPTEA
jgi:hypothetical protein